MTTIVVTTKVVKEGYYTCSFCQDERRRVQGVGRICGGERRFHEQGDQDAFFEMLEDQYDLESFDRAYAEYLKDPKTYTSDEVAKELGIK